MSTAPLLQDTTQHANRRRQRQGGEPPPLQSAQAVPGDVEQPPLRRRQLQKSGDAQPVPLCNPVAGTDDAATDDDTGSDGDGNGRGSKSRKLSPPSPTGARRLCILATILLTLFIMWVVMSMTTSFFPESFVGQEISDTMQGVVFASFPVGCMVACPLSSRITRWLGGPKNANLFGLTAMAVLPCVFGAVPFFISTVNAQYAFIAAGFTYGLLATVGEMASYALLIQMGAERGSVGLYVSVGEVVTGVGCMLGPPIGGTLFAAGAQLADDVQFFLPYAVVAVLPVLQVLIVLVVLPRGPAVSGDAGGKGGEPLCGGGRSKWRIGLVCVGVVITATSYAALSPTMEIRLHFLGVPDAALSSTTGLYLFLGSVLYMAGSLPIGRWIDKGCCTRKVFADGTPYTPPPPPAADSADDGTTGTDGPDLEGKDNPAAAAAAAAATAAAAVDDDDDADRRARFAAFTGNPDGPGAAVAQRQRVARIRVLPGVDVAAAAARGLPTHYVKSCCLALPPQSSTAPMILLAAGAVLNVVALALVGPFRLGDGLDLEVLDSQGVVLTALILQGLTSCLIVIPSMPALLLGIAADDAVAQARVAGVWGMVYAAGTSLGPFLGDVLLELKVPFLCRPYDWPRDNSTDSGSNNGTTPVVTGPTNSSTTTKFPDHKQHCFDGAFTLLALAGIVYAAVFLTFSACEFARHKRFR